MTRVPPSSLPATMIELCHFVWPQERELIWQYTLAVRLKCFKVGSMNQFNFIGRFPHWPVFLLAYLNGRAPLGWGEFLLAKGFRGKKPQTNNFLTRGLEEALALVVPCSFLLFSISSFRPRCIIVTLFPSALQTIQHLKELGISTQPLNSTDLSWLPKS